MAILNADEISGFYQRYIGLVDYINQINGQFRADLRIKQIQIPSTLTQSIIYHYIIQNPATIQIADFRRELLVQGHTRTYDLIYRSNPPINIEVKATGTNTFQRFRPHALTADFVFWINFHNVRLYDIAIFSPNILTRNAQNEVSINWHHLGNYDNVSFAENIDV